MIADTLRNPYLALLLLGAAVFVTPVNSAQAANVDFETVPGLDQALLVSGQGGAYTEPTSTITLTIGGGDASAALVKGATWGSGGSVSIGLCDVGCSLNALTTVKIKKQDGSNFSFTSVWIADAGGGGATTGSIEGWKGGSIVYGPTAISFSAATTVAPTGWDSLDEVRLISTNFWADLDNFTFGAEVIPNTAPTSPNLTQTVGFTEDTTTAIADMAITDPDADTWTATVTMAAGNSTLGSLSASSGNGETYNAVTAIWAITSANKTAVNNALAAMAFVPASNVTTTTTASTSIDDGVAAAITGTITFNGTPVDDAPSFNSTASFSINETATNDTTVLLDVQADDGDGGANDANVTYSITAGTGQTLFTIDSDDGEIRLNATGASTLDTESAGSYTLTVRANDTVNTTDQNITVTVSDIAPVITASQSFAVNESDANTTSMGTVATTGDDDSVTFSIQSGNTGTAFAINSGTGALTLNDTTQLDASATPSYTLGIRATDGTTPSNVNVTVNVTDDVAPTVSSVSSSTANGSYKVGDIVAVTVQFDEVVNVTATPQLTLETGTTDRTVNYTTGTGTDTLTFNYTVQTGDTSSDLDYLNTTALALNGGTIKDAAGNNATLTLASPSAAGSLGSNKALIIDTTAPTIATLVVSTDDVINASDTAAAVAYSGTTTGVEDGQTVTVVIGGVSVTPTVTSNAFSGTADLSGVADSASVSVTGDVADAAGNSATQFSNTISKDTATPTIATLVVSSDDVVNASDTAAAVAYSGTTTGVEDGQTVTVVIGGVSVTPTVTSNAFSGTADLSGVADNAAVAVTGDVSDSSGNAATPFSGTITKDVAAPSISGVSIPNTAMKVGDAVTVSIIASEAGLTLSSGTINGVAVTGFSDLGGGSYSATYTVSEGDTDRAVGDSIPLSFVLDDSAGNSSATYSTAITQNADSIDANSPTISGVTIPNAAMKVGDTVTVSVTASEAGLTLSSGIINGVAVTGFSDLTGGSYSATYTVSEGDTDRAVGDSIPVGFVLGDGVNNSAAYTTAITQNADSIDANSPTISGVTIPNATMKVGDAVAVTITASEAGLSLNSGTINGVAVTGFSDDGGGTYSATYTVGEGDTDRAVGDSIPVSFVLDDGAGNSSATYSAAITQNADSIDANSPAAPTGTLAVDENAANSTAVGTVSATGADSFSLTDDAGGRFAIDGSGNVTVANGTLLDRETNSSHNITVRASDNAGNTSDAVLTVTVNNVNEAPTLTNLNGDAISFSIGGNAVSLDNGLDATLADVDSVNFDGGTLTVAITANNVAGEDVLSIEPQGIGTGQIYPAAGNVYYEGTSIGVFTGGSDGADLVVTFSNYSISTLEAVQALLRAIQYNNTNAGTLSTAARNVRVTVTDGDGGSDTSTNQDITVNLVRAPIIDLDADNSSGNSSGGYNGSFTEGGGAVATADSDSLITDDGSYKSLTVTLANRPDGASESLSSTYGSGAQTVNAEAVTIGNYNSGSGELAITINDASTDAATVQMLMQSIRYNNSSDAPDTTSRNITYSATDNADNVGAVSTAVISVSGVNDPLTGSAVITGGSTPPVVGETLDADVTAISDADGLGTFAYQWKRGGAAIGSATLSSYTLQVADAGSTISVTVSYTDGASTVENTTSAATATVDGDLDGDGIGNASDPDIDGDGMLNTYEDANGLNKLDASDRNSDLDGDGVSNYDESVAATNANADDYPPVVTAPADVTVDAVGLFTPVTLGSATAVDALDGSVSTTSDAPTHFAPGINTVTWSATDAAGNTGTASQTVNVNPLVNFSKDQATSEDSGSSTTFLVILNGSAVSYPVTVPYSVSGSATSGVDYTALSGSVTIGSGTSTAVSITIVDDGPGEGTENIILTMGTPTHAVAGPKATHTINIVEGNVAPTASLDAMQGVFATTLVPVGDGTVTVTANAVDPNPGDTLSYDWSLTDNALVDSDGVADTFTFDPSVLTPGLYTLRLSVSDGTASDSTELSLNVVASAPVLTTANSDGEGADDQSEGYGDIDNDGVPDYLDAIPTGNVLQQQSGVSNSHVVETEDGLNLHLNHFALLSGNGRSEVSMADIESQGGMADDAVHYAYPGGLFDFAITGLPVAGQSVRVVLAQLAPVPTRAVYRKLMSAGWQEFVADASNSVASAAGEEGFCPPPGDAAYSAGLTEGDWCVQLTIEDGGPNDADGLANNRVVDPGGVAAILATDVNVEVSSGGGSVAPWWLVLLGLLGLPRLLAVRKGRAGK